MFQVPDYDDGGYDDVQERYGDTRLGPWDGDPDRDAWTGEWINPDVPEPVYVPPAFPTDPDAGEPPF
jgi:hypothetical protein